MMFDFERSMTKSRLSEFADYLQVLQRQIGFKISTRGWCYQLESERIINKDQFDKVERWINRCRKAGILPIDFIAEEEGRKFSGVETPEERTPIQYFGDYLSDALSCGNWYTPDWWEGETHSIQMLVEKIDLKTLFAPICQKYHIPIATSKGWSSMMQRAEYARRFREAEEKGLQCILLYCGDHDPDGLRISDYLRSNLMADRNIVWQDGTPGYNPQRLKVERFGLNYEFIEHYQLTWIDNLITGSGKNLASPGHKHHNMGYVQTYISTYGVRKCEANAIVPMPQIAREFVENTILAYLGDDAVDRFNRKRQQVREAIQMFQANSGLSEVLHEALEKIQNYG